MVRTNVSEKRVPDVWRSKGVQLLHTQMWCWGRDILAPEGNLLLDYGFQQSRPRRKDQGATCYLLKQDDVCIALWGFGIFYSRLNLGSVFLKRYEFEPRYSRSSEEPANVWSVDGILKRFRRSPLSRPQGWRTTLLWGEALDWIANYEAWIRDLMVEGYREECLDGWKGRPDFEVSDLPRLWNEMSDHVKKLLPEAAYEN